MCVYQIHRISNENFNQIMWKASTGEDFQGYNQGLCNYVIL